MSRVEKISIALTHEMAEMVRGAVQTGEYASTSEVVREALRDWKDKQLARHRHLEGVRQLWKEGIESGESRDGATVLEGARHRIRKRKSTGASK